jgi:DNA-3-methyladenine glycosylase I
VTADLATGDDGAVRCGWSAGDAAYRAYHDVEWGRVTRDERRLFEKLCLEGFQAGLSWLTILRKRPAFREVFADFDVDRVAAFGPGDVDRLLDDARIVRHRGKIEATIANARAVRTLHADGTTLTDLVWSHAPPAGPPPAALADIPAVTPASTALSKALATRGFRFVGPTTVYAFMQAMGLVNDHLAGCDVGDDLRRAAA